MLHSQILAPLVLDGEQVCMFTFYQDGSIKEGMRYGPHLYGNAYTFDSKNRLAAYDLAHQLVETHCYPVITISQQGYGVWVRLDAMEYPHWEAMNQTMDATVLAVGQA